MAYSLSLKHRYIQLKHISVLIVVFVQFRPYVPEQDPPTESRFTDLESPIVRLESRNSKSGKLESGRLEAGGCRIADWLVAASLMVCWLETLDLERLESGRPEP